MSDKIECPHCDDKALESEAELEHHIQITHELSRAERIEKIFGVTPTDYQAELLNYGAEKDRAQTAPKKGRQVGATTTAGMIGADHAILNTDTDILYAAPSQGTANEMFRECKKLFWNAESELSEFGVVDDNKETWEFSNGTRILSRTLGNVEQQNNSGNRGMNPTCVIVDEAAYEKDAVYTEEIEEFFITHEEYEYHLFSTPAPNGYFEEKVEVEGVRDVDKATDPFSWYSPHWPTRISPFAQEDFIEKKRKEYDEQTFAQEFLGEFPDDGGSAIPHDTLIPNINPDAERKPRTPRYLGVDPARKGDDEMVATDIDANGVVWNIWSFGEIDGPQFVDFLETVETTMQPPEPTVGAGTVPSNGYETILIEENGVGGFGADFANAGLHNIKVVNQTNKTKQNIYQRFIKDLEGEKLALPNHSKLVNQTTSLQKTFTPTNKAKYEHPSGGHDDWPDSIAMANWARHGGGEVMQTEAKQLKMGW